jgi:hypothetical protein
MMAKKAKKKSAVSRAVGSIVKAAKVGTPIVRFGSSTISLEVSIIGLHRYACDCP